MLKKTYKILNIFAKNLSMIYAFRDIKRLSKSKSESYTYNSLKKFVEEGILIQKKLGNSLLYSIAHNSKAIINLSIASEYEAWNKKHIPYMDIEKLVNKIHTYFFSLLITGSYARDDQKKESDIDIIIISNIDSKKIYAELRHICEMNIPPIHLYVFHRALLLIG